MFLLLDLCARDQIHLALFNEVTITHTNVPGRNRELLSILDDFLRQEKLAKEDVKGIMVVVGAGGFTNTRIATVVANTFGYVQMIPLVAIAKDEPVSVQLLIPKLLEQSIGQYISPSYSAAPNITMQKS